MAAIPSRRDSDGFSARGVGRDARRQLRLSFGLVVTLTLCIVTAAASVGHRPIPAKRGAASTLPVVSLHAAAGPVGARAI